MRITEGFRLCLAICEICFMIGKRTLVGCVDGFVRFGLNFAAAIPTKIFLVICLHNNAPGISRFSVCFERLVSNGIEASKIICFPTNCVRVMVAAVYKIYDIL